MISCTKFGHGPRRVIALHGWFGDHEAFDTMRSALTPGEFTYAFPAYRGYGLSKNLTGEFSIEEIASDTIALADEIGWGRFSMIGHSMGGMAVQRILANVPQRVERIVAITPVPACGVSLPADLQKTFAAAANDADARRWIMDMSTGNRLSRSWVNDMVERSLSNSTPRAFEAYFKAWTGSNFVEDIRGNPVPMQVIVGAHDPSLTADVMKATYLAWYPNARLEVNDNAGHYPMNETPIALATTIEAFLRADGAWTAPAGQ